MRDPESGPAALPRFWKIPVIQEATPLSPFRTADIRWSQKREESRMEPNRKSNADHLKGLVYAGLILVGIFSSLRYGVEWAYALGKFAGAA
jgi:hypothetical protein